ncbi:tumor necrosis factor receptor superfamily member 4 [Ooceraea biroi]|uniref:tumor necrosis factor receptor superfamily member 4 n=1 Tax=Ooceraea biroi TaxID=2015173 RepID=UPI0005BE04E3|nr:tumor necrosis factor receptor superfamily member 4 [Ooceraea biroi]
MDNRRELSNRHVMLAIIACVLVIFIEAGDGRPHIRHHRDGSHCSRCGPGWGVISRCSRGRDTECGKCPAGTYSPHHNTQPCWNCARCGPGLYEAHPCTPRSDTVCDSCHRPAPDNPDYQRKCEGRARFFLAPEDARNTAEESVLVNEPAYRFQVNDRERILQEDVEAVLRDKSAAQSDDPRRI